MGRDMQRICANCEELLARVIDEAQGPSPPSFSELHAGLRTKLSIYIYIEIYIMLTYK